MIAQASIEGSIQRQASISGTMQNKAGVSGTVSVGGGGGSKNAVLYVEQELTPEQSEQARNNIKTPGLNVTGNVYTPYTVDEPNGYVYVYDEPIEAANGAEIFNNYAENIATGNCAAARGHRTQALGAYSEASGFWTKASGAASRASGLLSIASAPYAISEGTRTTAASNNAHAEGESSIASGGRSHAEGYGSTASGNQSHSEGMFTTASGLNSHAEGEYTEAKNRASFAAGKNTISTGQYAFACGRYTEAKATAQFVCGQYNVADTTSMLIVGKGSSTSKTSNAFTVSNTGVGWFASTVTSTGADYAEYFEWFDGNPNAEDRVGRVVTLVGDKIQFANAGDDMLGVVSGTALVLGDNAAYEWKNRYLTDAFGRIIYDDPVEEFDISFDPDSREDVTESIGFYSRPIINPEYDPTKVYVPRAERKEWDAIGMIGKLHIIDDGTCVVGKYAKISTNGIITASDDRTSMRVMRRIADNVVLVLLK